ncbi:MAG: PDZ domain-containing protein, partial [Saprospiraceae bacterium]|nr:PDZ domain-containing protein [Saprospiraceae bacterium]
MRTLLLLLVSSVLCTVSGFSANSIPGVEIEKLDCDRGFLGIETDNISIEKANFLNLPNPYGSYVTRVYANSAADKAGIEAFDYIVGINEDMLDEENGLTDLLSEYKPGDEVVLRVIRNGKPMDLDATLGKVTDFAKSFDIMEKPFFGVSKTGPEADEVGGVMINIVHNSSAANMGLQDGD